MNKILLLLCIKGLIFVFKSSTEENIDFIYCKLIFCFLFKIYVLLVSKLIDLFFLSAVKKVGFPQSKKFFLDQVTFSQSRNFSQINEFLHGHGNFPHSRNFSTVVKFFHNQRTFPQSWKFSAIK